MAGRQAGKQAVAAGKRLRQASGCGRQADAAGNLLRQASCCGRQAVAAGKHSSGMQADSGRLALCADQHAVSQVTGGGAARQAGRQAGSRLVCRRAEGRHAGFSQASVR